jgi:hypothetical protein
MALDKMTQAASLAAEVLRHRRALKAPVAGQNAGAKAPTQATYLAFPRPACSKLKLGIGLPMALDKMTQTASLAAEVLRHRRALKAPVAGQNVAAKAHTETHMCRLVDTCFQKAKARHRPSQRARQADSDS